MDTIDGRDGGKGKEGDKHGDGIKTATTYMYGDQRLLSVSIISQNESILSII